MYAFFLFFFIFISVTLTILILFQSGKGLNNTVDVHGKNNIKFFNRTGIGNFYTNIIAVLSFLFLLISIILCNYSNKINNTDVFLNNLNGKKNIEHSIPLNKRKFNTDVPD